MTNHKFELMLSKTNSAIAKITKNDDDFLKYIKNKTTFLNIDTVLQQRLYHIKKNIFENIKCPYCNVNFLHWNIKKIKYIKTC